ncbi:MAG: 3'-5' exonuclease [Planctomycetaceae bacterium]
MRYIIFDLEATCWQDVRDYNRMETIEIGAVELLEASAPHSREFSSFIRPVAEPLLSDFCKELTSIRQSDVDKAEYFGSVFYEFIDWIGSPPFILCSWGGYDMTQFKIDCSRHKVEFPERFEAHINLKKQFGNNFNAKKCGMKRALSIAGLTIEGTHHRGIDDARNIAKLANILLPVMETSGQIPEVPTTE